MTDFRNIKRELDELLSETRFETQYGYAFRDGVIIYSEIDGVCVMHKGPRPRRVFCSVNSQEELDLFKEFVNNWRKPLLDIRKALKDETYSDRGCTFDVIECLVDQVLGYEENMSDIELLTENAPSLERPALYGASAEDFDPFLDVNIDELP